MRSLARLLFCLVLLSGCAGDTPASGSASAVPAPEARQSAAGPSTEASEDRASGEFAVGDCTSQSVDARILAGSFEPAACDAPEANSRVVQVIDDPRGCADGQAAVTPVGPDNPTYCLEAL